MEIVDTGDAREDDRDDNDLAEETNEEELWREEAEYKVALTLTELQDIVETMVHATWETSLEDTSKVGTSGVPSDSTIPLSDMSGTNASIEPTLLPLVIILPRTDAQDDSTPSEIPNESTLQA